MINTAAAVKGSEELIDDELASCPGAFAWPWMSQEQLEPFRSCSQSDAFFAVENRLRANAGVRKMMAGYHELVERGRREIYRLES